MIIKMVDAIWSFVLLVIACTGVWQQIKHKTDVRKTWFWYAALCWGWGFAGFLSLLDGDELWVIVACMACALISGFHWSWQHDRAKELDEIESQRDFDEFRIDDLPKN